MQVPGWGRTLFASELCNFFLVQKYPPTRTPNLLCYHFWVRFVLSTISLPQKPFKSCPCFHARCCGDLLRIVSLWSTSCVFAFALRYTTSERSFFSFCLNGVCLHTPTVHPPSSKADIRVQHCQTPFPCVRRDRGSSLLRIFNLRP